MITQFVYPNCLRRHALSLVIVLAHLRIVSTNRCNSAPELCASWFQYDRIHHFEPLEQSLSDRHVDSAVLLQTRVVKALDGQLEVGPFSSLRRAFEGHTGRFICKTIVPTGLVLIFCVAGLRLCVEWTNARLPESDNSHEVCEARADDQRIEAQTEKLPCAIWLAGPVLAFICNANLTIAMPLSRIIADLSGGSVGESGVMIGSWAAGGILGLVAFWCHGCSRLRSCYLAQSLLMLLGGIVEILVVSCMNKGFNLGIGYAVARGVQGLGCGAQYNALLGVTQASTPSLRSTYYGYIAAGGALGVICGPILSSAAEFLAAFVGVNSYHGAYLCAPGWVICACGSVGFTVVLACCPSDSDLREACNVGITDLGAEPKHQSQRTAMQPDCSTRHGTESLVALGFAVLLAAPIMRCMMRLSWEVGAMLILQETFDRPTASALTALVAVGYVISQFAYATLAQKYSAHDPGIGFEMRIIACLEVAAFLGVSLMLVPGTTSFLAGSALLYSASVLSAAPVQSVCVGLVSCSRSWLSVGTLLLASQSVWVVACLLAPMYSRSAMASTQATQASLVAILAPVLVCQVLVNELGLRGVRKPSSDRCDDSRPKT